MWKELAQVDHKQVGVRGGRSYLPEPEHPGGLNPRQASEGDAGIEIGATGFLKARRYFGEAAYDHAHPSASREYGVGTVVADESCHG